MLVATVVCPGRHVVSCPALVWYKNGIRRSWVCLTGWFVMRPQFATRNETTVNCHIQTRKPWYHSSNGQECFREIRENYLFETKRGSSKLTCRFKAGSSQRERIIIKRQLPSSCFLCNFLWEEMKEKPECDDHNFTRKEGAFGSKNNSHLGNHFCFTQEQDRDTLIKKIDFLPKDSSSITLLQT